jgi:hypothetical protein
MSGIAWHPVIDIGAKAQQPPALAGFVLHLHREEGSIVDADADLLDRCHQIVLAVLALENG